MPLFLKKYKKKCLLHVNTKSFKETILYSRGTFNVADALSAWRRFVMRMLIREAHVCIAEAHGVRGFPPSQFTILKNLLMVIFKEFKYLLNLTNICSTEL